MNTPLNKRILRQEASVVLVEIAKRARTPGGPCSVTYLVTSKRTPKLYSFDDSAAANECFEAELAHCGPASRRLAHAGA
jgi:hypothetical protein